MYTLKKGNRTEKQHLTKKKTYQKTDKILYFQTVTLQVTLVFKIPKAYGKKKISSVSKISPLTFRVFFKILTAWAILRFSQPLGILLERYMFNTTDPNN